MPQTANLGWNANTESNLAGYKIYVSTSSGFKTQVTNSPKDVGNTLTGSFALPADGIFFFTLTAYNTSFQESSFSNIIVADFETPLPPATPLPNASTRRGMFCLNYR